MKIALCFRFSQTFFDFALLRQGQFLANDGEKSGKNEEKINKQAYPYIQNVATF